MRQKPERFPPDFFTRYDTVKLARALLGQKLVTSSRGALTSGMIVEVEGYLGHNDPACHAARGMTKRNEVMFTSAGHCYVYLIYGIYHCVNVVSETEGVDSGVLIRAIEPLNGLETMKRRRAPAITRDLTRGPGRLCQAMGISKSFLGEHLSVSDRIWLEPYRDIPSDHIATSGRLGISKGGELPLRFFIRGNPYVSGRTRP